MSEQITDPEFGVYAECTESQLDGWTVGKQYGVTMYDATATGDNFWLTVQDNNGDMVNITHNHNVKFNMLWGNE